MDDFFTYFLAGMLGEELLRKIATRPFGFMILWLIGFILVNIIFLALFISLIIFAIFTERAVNQSILHYLSHDAYDAFIFVLVEILPWAELFSLMISFLLSLSYLGHYRNNQREKENSTHS